MAQMLHFYDIRRQQITQFLDTKIKTVDIDPDKKYITTWNDYLNYIKCFFRWLFKSRASGISNGYYQYSHTYMSKLNMRLSPKHEEKINILRAAYDATSNAQVNYYHYPNYLQRIMNAVNSR
jgi:hypothetical protein